MKESFEIKITVNYEDDRVSIDTESQIIGEGNPSVYFLALSKYFHRHVLSDLESKLKISDEMADLIKLCVDNGIGGSEDD